MMFVQSCVKTLKGSSLKFTLTPKRSQRLRGSEGGFTLTELVISAALVVTVVTLGGYGMSILFRTNRAQALQADRRAELNRAAEFISAEIRQSNKLINPKDVTISGISNFNNVNRHLAFEMGSNVVYFSADANPDQKWLGNSVLYRYGPPPDEPSETPVITPMVDFLNDVAVDPPPDDVKPESRVATITLTGKLNNNNTYRKQIRAYIRATTP